MGLQCCVERRDDTDPIACDAHMNMAEGVGVLQRYPTSVTGNQSHKTVRAAHWHSSGGGSPIRTPRVRSLPPQVATPDASLADAHVDEYTSCPDALVLKEVVRLAGEMLPATMSEWQRSWCKPAVVRKYLSGRNGDVVKAAEILSQALAWRARHQEVLTGIRTPVWQGDLRVLARCKDGCPIIYFCAAQLPSKPVASHQVEHTAAVLEAAVSAMKGDADSFYVIYDAYGFKLANNWNPRPVVAFAEMLKQPYRDRLKQAVVVSAPWTFDTAWRLFANAVPASTRSKVGFASFDDFAKSFENVVGAEAASIVEGVMRRNRSPSPSFSMQRPCELPDHSAAEETGKPALRPTEDQQESQLCTNKSLVLPQHGGPVGFHGVPSRSTFAPAGECSPHSAEFFTPKSCKVADLTFAGRFFPQLVSA